MVSRREVCLGEPAAENQLGLHAVRTRFGHREVLGLRGLRGAVAVDQDGNRAVGYGRAVPGDAGEQAVEFGAVAVPRDVEHVVTRHEAEGILGRGRVGGVVCRLAEGRTREEAQRKQ